MFVVAKVTETRTGPLGCSNYDNLDSVSSVLVQSPENKVHLQGLYYIFSWLRIPRMQILYTIVTLHTSALESTTKKQKKNMKYGL